MPPHNPIPRYSSSAPNGPFRQTPQIAFLTFDSPEITHLCAPNAISAGPVRRFLSILVFCFSSFFATTHSTSSRKFSKFSLDCTKLMNLSPGGHLILAASIWGRAAIPLIPEIRRIVPLDDILPFKWGSSCEVPEAITERLSRDKSAGSNDG